MQHAEDEATVSRRVDPDAAAEVFRAAELEPVEPFPGAGVPWRAAHLPCGRVIAPTLNNVRRRGSACRDCAAVRRGASRRAGGAARALAVLRESGFEPLEEYPGHNAPWRCRHEACGDIVTPTLAGVLGGGVMCRRCSSLALGHRLWTAESAERTFREAGLTPLEAYPGSSTRAWRARHEACGSEVSPRLGNVAAGQDGCAACGRRSQVQTQRSQDRSASAPRRSVPESERWAVMLEAGLEPIEAYPGVDHAWRCRHLPCGKLVAPTYSNVKRGQGGCQSCGLARLSERFRLDPHEAEDRLRRAGLEALEPYPGSSKPWRARHLQCGRVVTPTLANVQAGRGLCRYCYSDFPYASAAQLYLATDGFALKVGICAPGSDRLRQHRRWGWSICWVVDVSSGDEAWNVEQAVISWWRRSLQQPPAYSPAEMPQLGATETVRADALSESDVLRFVMALLGETSGR